jgi:biotin operon repressor
LVIYSDAEILKMLNETGKTQHELADHLGINRSKVAHAIRRAQGKPNKRYDEEPEVESDSLTRQLQQLLIKGDTRGSLCEKLNISDRILTAAIEELGEIGYQVEEMSGTLKLCRDVIPQDQNLHEAPWKGNRVIRFGLCGDHQLNSKYTQITHAHKLYDIYEQEGIKVVYHTGDIDEGEQMRPGHQYECYNQGADDHVAEIIKNYPRRSGMKTYFITGNHDHSLIKRAGYDIGKPIAEKRDDMVYLGQSYATINLTPNCILELRHPGDGTAYALSYKMQKMVDAMSGGEKPNILAVGHYHKVEYLFYRNIHIYQTGCLQAQTPWMRGRQIAAMMGGWIIEAHVDKEGTIIRMKQEFIPFYYGIPDDYKNWQ